METLLAKYLAKPTQANAIRVADYNRKHPFAECMLGRLESAVLAEAKDIAAAAKAVSQKAA